MREIQITHLKRTFQIFRNRGELSKSLFFLIQNRKKQLYYVEQMRSYTHFCLYFSSSHWLKQKSNDSGLSYKHIKLRISNKLAKSEFNGQTRTHFPRKWRHSPSFLSQNHLS